MAFGGDCGIDLHIDENERADFTLFNETAGTFVVEVDDPEQAEALFGDVPHMVVGKTKEDKTVSVSSGEKKLFDADLYVLKEAWQRPMRELFHQQHGN
jgi:phosphoribosylformylglycinamidine (FGAM) synthase-like enzyme